MGAGLSLRPPQHVVPFVVGVQNGMPLLRDKGRGGQGISLPSVDPVGADDPGIQQAAPVVPVIVHPVVVHHRRGSLVHDHPGHVVGVADKQGVALVPLLLQPGEAGHRAHVVAVFIRPEVDIFASVVHEPSGILFHQGPDESRHLRVLQIHGGNGSLIGGMADPQLLHGGEGGFHMPGGIHQRDNLQPFLSREGQHPDHLFLRPLVPPAVAVGPVAGAERGLHRLAAVGLPFRFDRHVVQQEAPSAVADTDFHGVISVRIGLGHKILHLLRRKILPAGIHVKSPQLLCHFLFFLLDFRACKYVVRGNGLFICVLPPGYCSSAAACSSSQCSSIRLSRVSCARARSRLCSGRWMAK